jgi:hypothetical protein
MLPAQHRLAGIGPVRALLLRSRCVSARSFSPSHGGMGPERLVPVSTSRDRHGGQVVRHAAVQVHVLQAQLRDAARRVARHTDTLESRQLPRVSAPPARRAT